jgi:multiple sugar transport system permease protein
VQLTDIWQWTPFVALVVLAGIQGVPPEIIEAARVDGAGGVRIFWRIILPQLRFIIAIVLIIRLMQSFNVFDAVYAETMGGPGTATTSLSYLLYENGLRYYNLGLAFAMAWLITAIALVMENVYVAVAFRGIEL